MTVEPDSSFVAECFWPDISEGDVVALDERIRNSLTDGVRYLGSTLIRADEVLLCQFVGSMSAVRAVADRAGVPYERLLETTVHASPAGPTPPGA